jgi:hemerythrin-like metal-binding protein
MTFIVWDDSLDLHIDMINEEHKTLISLMNKLYEQNSDDVPKEVVKATLSELAAYASKHFSDEEDYMASIKYHDLEVHRSIHQRLLNRISAFSLEYADSNKMISEDFFTFLKIWVTAHIKGIDIKYANAS